MHQSRESHAYCMELQVQYILAGEVLALMGPSGRGKTTLLNLFEVKDQTNSGTITYNDRPYTKLLKGCKSMYDRIKLIKYCIDL